MIVLAIFIDPKKGEQILCPIREMSVKDGLTIIGLVILIVKNRLACCDT